MSKAYDIELAIIRCEELREALTRLCEECDPGAVPYIEPQIGTLGITQDFWEMLRDRENGGDDADNCA